MNPEQVKQIKDQIEKMKAKAIEYINKIEVTEDGRVLNTFVMFNFTEGQPEIPITPGVDKDVFGAIAEDFIKYLEVAEKEEKINTIKDEKMRNRLLNNLRSNLK